MTGARGAGATTAAVVATDLVVAFGIVVGLNQLATQSPVDAILPVALFSVGVGGILTLVAAALGTSSAASDDERHDRGPFAAPTMDQGSAAFALGLLALAAVGWQWGLAAQAALVAAQGVLWLLAAERGLVQYARDAHRGPAGARVVLVGAEAVLLIAFAWAALADGGVRPFS